MIIRSENGGDLPLAVRGIQRIFDLIHRHSTRGSRIAVDFNINLGIPDLEIAADVRQSRQRTHFIGEILRRGVKLRKVGILYRKLVQSLGL